MWHSQKISELNLSSWPCSQAALLENQLVGLLQVFGSGGQGGSSGEVEEGGDVTVGCGIGLTVVINYHDLTRQGGWPGLSLLASGECGSYVLPNQCFLF